MNHWIRKLFSKPERKDTSETEGPDAILVRVYEKVSEKRQLNGFDDLKAHEKAFLLVWILEGEVNNGGFDQYFFNSSGNLAKETLEALREIEAHKTASLLDEAMSLFSRDSYPVDRDMRQTELLSKLSPDCDRFEEFNQRFLDYEEDVSSLALAYYTKAEPGG